MNILVYEKISTKINENDSYIKSKEIICPKCLENCRIIFNDFKITLYGCKDGHRINDILLDEFNNTQNINESSIICQECKTINKYISYNKQFYICLDCNRKICPLCNSKHNKNHKIIDYDKKNFICNIHNDLFISYCKKCNINLCELCDKNHNISHKIIYYKDIIPDENIIKEEINKFEKKIDKFKNIIQKIINILNKTIENLEIFYKINTDIINKFEFINRNYQILENINGIKDNLKIDNINQVINDNIIENQIKNIIHLYNKMNNNSKLNENNINSKKKENENKDKNDEKEFKNKIYKNLFGLNHVKTFSNIKDLIKKAKKGDTIKLSGYYSGNGNIIHISKKINIIGENDTVLDAKGISGIFFISGENVVINNLKLVNAINTHKIGAIRWQGDNGILSNCTLENNNDKGFGYGGAIFWWATNGKITNCIFKNNKVSHYGGAIYINGKSLKVTNSLFENNSVLETYNRWEGG